MICFWTVGGRRIDCYALKDRTPPGLSRENLYQPHPFGRQCCLWAPPGTYELSLTTITIVIDWESQTKDVQYAEHVATFTVTGGGGPDPPDPGPDPGPQGPW